jgi:hypothetical protein
MHFQALHLSMRPRFNKFALSWRVPVMRLLTAVRPAISMHVKCAGTREAGL